MKRLLIIIAVGLALVGGAAWAYFASAAGSPRWAEPADYSYRLQHTAFGPGVETFDITVRDHEVTALERLPGSNQSDAERGITVENAWTLADLVDEYLEAKAGHESDAKITYDAATGAPVTIYLDWVVGAVDDEEYFSILAFDPFPTSAAT